MVGKKSFCSEFSFARDCYCSFGVVTQCIFVNEFVDIFLQLESTVAAGTKYHHSLLWVVLLSPVISFLVQIMAIRLGVFSGLILRSFKVLHFFF